jgi:hypothetical protein
MAFIKDLFTGAPKPKMPAVPSTSSAQIQQTQENARRVALLAKGRSSTILTGNNLGAVG